MDRGAPLSRIGPFVQSDSQPAKFASIPPLRQLQLNSKRKKGRTENASRSREIKNSSKLRPRAGKANPYQRPNHDGDTGPAAIAAMAGHESASHGERSTHMY